MMCGWCLRRVDDSTRNSKLTLHKLVSVNVPELARNMHTCQMFDAIYNTLCTSIVANCKIIFELKKVDVNWILCEFAWKCDTKWRKANGTKSSRIRHHKTLMIHKYMPWCSPKLHVTITGLSDIYKDWEIWRKKIASSDSKIPSDDW